MSKGNASTGYLQNILNVSDIVKKKISKGDAFLNFIKPPCYQKYYTILKEQIEQVDNVLKVKKYFFWGKMYILGRQN